MFYLSAHLRVDRVFRFHPRSFVFLLCVVVGVVGATSVVTGVMQPTVAVPLVTDIDGVADGFYPPEGVAGSQYRWSKPHATVSVPTWACAETVTIRYSTARLPTAPTPVLHVALDGADVGRSIVLGNADKQSLVLHIQGGRATAAQLTFDVQPPYLPPADKRVLGIAVFAVEVEADRSTPLGWLPTAPVIVTLALSALLCYGLLQLAWHYRRGVRSDGFICVLLGAGVSIGSLACAPGDLTGTNDGSHFALVRALADTASVRIDPFMAYTQRTDYAVTAPGYFFTDRPPGTGVAAVPFYVVGRVVRPLVRLPPLSPFLPDLSLAVWATCLSAFALGGTAATLYALARLLGCGRAAALGTALAYVVGTIGLKYGGLLYAHALGAMLLAVGLWLGCRFFADPPLLRRSLGLVVAAFCFGYAVTVEYTNLIPAAVFALCACWRLLAIRRVSGAVVGAAVAGLLPLAALGWYNAANFGTPLTTAYAFSGKWVWSRTLPTTFDQNPAPGLWNFIFGTGDPMRGLLVLSPVFFLAGWGCVVWLRAGGLRRAYVAATLVASGTLWVVMAAHHTYWGGGDRDPRYLSAILPLLLLPMAGWWQRYVTEGRYRWRMLALLVGCVGLSCAITVFHLFGDYPSRWLKAATDQPITITPTTRTTYSDLWQRLLPNLAHPGIVVGVAVCAIIFAAVAAVRSATRAVARKHVVRKF